MAQTAITSATENTPSAPGDQSAKPHSSIGALHSFCAYFNMLNTIHRLIALGQGDTTEANNIREHMVERYKDFSVNPELLAASIHLSRSLSIHYAEQEDAANQVKPVTQELRKTMTGLNLPEHFKRDNWTNEEVIEIVKGQKLVHPPQMSVDRTIEHNRGVDSVIEAFEDFQRPAEEMGAMAYNFELKQIIHIGQIPT